MEMKKLNKNEYEYWIIFVHVLSNEYIVYTIYVIYPSAQGV